MSYLRQKTNFRDHRPDVVRVRRWCGAGAALA
jgi:hypothetical protein